MIGTSRSIQSSWKLLISIDLNNCLKLVRDQGVGGSNPLSPTILQFPTCVPYRDARQPGLLQGRMLLVRQFQPEHVFLRKIPPFSELKDMARFARVIAVGVAHHVTQRGNARQLREFVHELEGEMQRRLAPRKGGRPAALVKDERQGELAFGP